LLRNLRFLFLVLALALPDLRGPRCLMLEAAYSEFWHLHKCIFILRQNDQGVYVDQVIHSCVCTLFYYSDDALHDKHLISQSTYANG
jgi:hypothetical protein